MLVTPVPLAAFRVDASMEIGTGHIMRCLTLADALAKDGAKCHFLCRDLRGHLTSLVRERGHRVHLLPRSDEYIDDRGTAHSAWLGVSQAYDAIQSRDILEDLQPDWLIVDHYALSSDWEAAAKPPSARMMVIDDLADRPHSCDLLLDQNLGREASDYDGLVPESCNRLIGPRFALLRPEFVALRDESLGRRRDGRLERILVSMGGVDKDNVTGRVLDTLAGVDLPEGMRIDVVMGPNAPHFEDVREHAATMPVPTHILRGVNDMAALMAQSDLALGAAGSTSWERCCLGLPTVVVTVAANQEQAAAALEEAGAAILLGDVHVPALASRIRDAVTMLCTPEKLAETAKNAARLVDGVGTQRVCDAIALQAYVVREATVADAKIIYSWRYSGNNVGHYRNPRIPEYDQHLAWLKAAVGDADRRLLMIAWQGTDIGHVRFDVATDDRRNLLVSICVDPDARGQGHSAGVLQAAMSHLRDMGMDRFIAEVHPDNVASCRLFERLGFRYIGTANGFRQYAVLSDTARESG